MSKIIEYLKDTKCEHTAHLAGFKRVFVNFSDTESNLTQLAYGELKPGEVVEDHIHPTMEEFFFFLKGNGTYTIDSSAYNIKPNTFIRIPPNVKHSLEVEGIECLVFIYFGIGL